ncbi:glycosyltransferase family 4 protein [Phycicoccus sp. HDW14]|uniref:glycosyltransferase family 4 protein n=1 Tax=Phycicoccus sp. HDW14 TaxID=2714941 RepID=UPI0014094C7B|nr:glycosyltransferase family 4 protein [Phycicoccus sp. HDW14]QIM21711.1 glycosyltransferase family 4 protein [Phycicoccus sp. HDW14]
MSRADPPRVLYSFPHTLGAPGIGTTAAAQVRGALDAGVRLTVVCTSSTADTTGADLRTTLTLLGHRVPHRVFVTPQRAYDHHDRAVAALLAREDFDVVHTWPRSCLRTLATARRRGVPSLREAPSPHTRSALEEARRAAAEWGLELPSDHSHAYDEDLIAREEAEYEAADLLLVPSDYARGTFERAGHPADRLVSSRYGYDPGRFRPADRAPGTRRPPTAVFLGRGEPNKGLHVALDAWFGSGAPERGGRFVVAGSLWAPYAERLADRLAHSSVEVAGFVDDTPALLAASDVLLLPSWTEGSALVTYEAMGSGCVPLVSDATGAPVLDGVDGFVHRVGDTATLTAQLSALWDDPLLLERTREAVLARRDELTWAAAGRRLAEVYRSVRDGEPAG